MQESRKLWESPQRAEHLAPILAIFGMLICALIAALPELAPAMVGRAGHVWTPFNSSNFRVGDLYYYAPWVRQVLDFQVPLRPPTAGALDTGATVENIRAAPYLLAALPGAVLADFRSVILADIAFSAALFFLSFYVLGLVLLRSPCPSFLAAFAAYFFSGLWQAIAHNGSYLTLLGQSPSVAQWFDFSLNSVGSRWAILLDPTEYDYVSDAFRYMNLSFSAPLLTSQLVAAVMLFYRATYLRALATFILSLAIAFSYPSHPLIGYLALIALAAAALAGGQRRNFVALMLTGSAVAATLLGIGYPAMVRDAVAGTAMLQAVYVGGGVAVGPLDPRALLYTILLNKYLWTTLLIVGLFWSDRRARIAVGAVGVAVTLVSFVTLLNPPDLWQRFLARGIEVPWGGFVAIGIVRGLLLLTKPRRDGVAAGQRALIIGLIIAAIAVPAIGLGRFAVRNTENLSRFISQDRWDAYRWVAEHVPRRAAVAALDWNDLVFLPMYTNASLTTGHADLSGRSPEEQLRRFVFVWKLMGRSEADLANFVRGSVPALLRRGLGNPRKPPMNDPTEYDAAEFAAGLLYWPYIKSVDGIAIANAELTGTNSELVAHAVKLFQHAKGAAFEAAYVVASTADDRGRTREGWEIVFQNSERTIYRLTDARQER